MAFILFVGGIVLGFGIGWIAWGNRVSDLRGEVRRQISLRKEHADEHAAERQALARAEERIAETQAELSGALMQNDQLRAEHWELRRSLALANGQIRQAPAPAEEDTSALETALATAEQALEDERAEQATLEAELRAVRAERDAEAGQVAALRAELAAGIESAGELEVVKPKSGNQPRKRIAQILREAQSEGPVQRTVSDDLTAINGIGPLLRRKLQELGITNLRQIATMSPEDVERVDSVLNVRGRIARERWIEQARDILSAR